MIREKNITRAKRSFDRVHGYGASYAYSTLEPQDFTEDDKSMLHQQLADLLCDLRHLSDVADVSWDEVSVRGLRHYEAERGEGDDIDADGPEPGDYGYEGDADKLDSL